MNSKVLSLLSTFSVLLICLKFVNIGYAQTRPLLDVPTLDGAGNMNLHVRGDSGTNYTVDASVDLVSWWRLFSDVASNGAASFQYSPDATSGNRYFRARVAPPLSPVNVIVGQESTPRDLTLVTPENGGTLSFTDTNGITYSLTVPANAVIDPQVFTMTLVTKLGNLPFEAGLLGAVTLGPDSIELLEPVQLDITFPTNSPVDALAVVGYAFGSNGEDLFLLPTFTEATRATIFLGKLGGVGCSVATLAEVQQQARRHIAINAAGTSAQSTGALTRQAEVRTASTAFAPLPFLAHCRPDGADRAREVEDQIIVGWAAFTEDMVAQGKAQQVANFFWGRSDPYQDFFSDYIKPYVAEAQSNCALSHVLSHWTGHLTFYAERGGAVKVKESIDTSGLCKALDACTIQITGCCGLFPTDPQGADHDLRTVQADANSLGCPLDPTTVNNTQVLCRPPWYGTLNYTETWHRSTNILVGTHIEEHLLDYQVTVVLHPESNLKAGTLGDGRHTLEGTLSGYLSGTYHRNDKNKSLTCCGDCYDEQDEKSAIGKAFSGAMNLSWSPIPGDRCLSCSMGFAPDTNANLVAKSIIQGTTVTTSSSGNDCIPRITVAKPISSQYGFSFLLTVASFDATILEFLSPPGASVQASEEGTDASVSGSYGMTYTDDDGTVRTVKSDWNFSTTNPNPMHGGP